MDDRRLLDPELPDPAEAIEKIAQEFRAGFELVDRVERPAVTVFGSARVAEGHPAYDAARVIGHGFATRGWAVVTGGGPGVMEAANRGAKEGGGQSVGFNIALPHEQASNPFLDISFTFEHLYARKVCFVKPSEGFVVLPGGFGTLDELYEALTLIQTGMVRDFPVVLFGAEHWDGMLDWVRDELAADRMISKADLELFCVTDDPAEAVEVAVDCYERRCAQIRTVVLD
jgi:hypothetical protein